MGLVYTENGQRHHLEGCFHIAESRTFSGTGGLPPCTDCLNGKAVQENRVVSNFTSGTGIYKRHEVNKEPIVEAPSPTTPDFLETMSLKEIAERTGIAAFASEDMSSLAWSQMECLRHIARAHGLYPPHLRHSTPRDTKLSLRNIRAEVTRMCTGMVPKHQ